MKIGSLVNRIKIALAFADVAVTIEDGRAKAARGAPRSALLAALSDLAAANDLKTGLILARGQDADRRLTISSDIPERLHQRIRNIWGANTR